MEAATAAWSAAAPAAAARDSREGGGIEMRKSIPPVKHDAPGMRGQRGRDTPGHLRQVRSDKLVRTIEAEYGVDFGVRGDMTLGTLRGQAGVTSMKELLGKAKKLD